MEQKFCQSCGALLENDSMLGTEKNGNKNQEYCNFCYEKGDFTHKCTMEEMIQYRVQNQFVEEFNKQSVLKYTVEEAVVNMRQFYPNLKRWRKQEIPTNTGGNTASVREGF